MKVARLAIAALALVVSTADGWPIDPGQAHTADRLFADMLAKSDQTASLQRLANVAWSYKHEFDPTEAVSIVRAKALVTGCSRDYLRQDQQSVITTAMKCDRKRIMGIMWETRKDGSVGATIFTAAPIIVAVPQPAQ